MKQLPNLHVFNPSCEIERANGSPTFMINKRLQKLETDMEFTPIIFASDGDYILTTNQPSEELLNYFKLLNFPNALFITHKELIITPTLKLSSIKPWGWSPATHFRLNTLKNKCSNSFKDSLMYNWTNQLMAITGRESTIKVLNEIKKTKTNIPIVSKNLFPTKATDVSAIENAQKQWNKIVLKSPWSSSGRGIQMLRKNELNQSNIQWIKGILKQQKYIIVEPLLNKVLEFSLQFKFETNNIEFIDSLTLKTSENGTYIGNYIHSENELKKHITQKQIETLSKTLINAFKKLKFNKIYNGYAGVDCMFFEYNNSIYLHPCIEINWRKNMGLVASYLKKYVHTNSKSILKTFYSKNENFLIFHNKMKAEYPAIIENNKLIKGYVPLSNPQNTQTGLYFIAI